MKIRLNKKGVINHDHPHVVLFESYYDFTSWLQTCRYMGRTEAVNIPRTEDKFNAEYIVTGVGVAFVLGNEHRWAYRQYETPKVREGFTYRLWAIHQSLYEIVE
jgi:hypothetical protein